MKKKLLINTLCLSIMSSGIVAASQNRSLQSLESTPSTQIALDAGVPAGPAGLNLDESIERVESNSNNQQSGVGSLAQSLQLYSYGLRHRPGQVAKEDTRERKLPAQISGKDGHRDPPPPPAGQWRLIGPEERRSDDHKNPGDENPRFPVHKEGSQGGEEIFPERNGNSFPEGTRIRPHEGEWHNLDSRR